MRLGRGERLALVACTATFAALALPAFASGAVRYAEPGAGGSDPSCPQADPCDLEEAVELAADGDEVVINAGTYSMSAPLSVGGAGTFVHGAAGQPMPVLETSGFTGVGASNSLATVRRLEIRHTGSGGSLNLGGTGEQLVVRALSATTDEACDIGFFAELRDTICSAPVGAVPAIRAIESGALTRTLFVRNVTAVSAGSFGLIARAETGMDMTIDVKSSILRGGAGTDIRAETDGMASTTATVTLTHSNYSTATAAGGGSVTTPGSGTNQLSMPLFANAGAGDFRQAAGSPTRNTGTTDVESGSADFEGEPRSQESAPDIGADEFDVIPPIVAITSGPSPGKAVGTKNVSFGFTSTDFLATFACALDGGGFAPCSGPGNSHVANGLADGTHTFSVRATDTNGLSSSAVRSFTIDTDPPQSRITKGPPNRTEKEKAKFKFRADEPGATFRCKIDGKRFRPCTSPRVYKKLDEKKHKFKVVATDAAGNVDPTPDTDRWRVLD